MWGMSASELAAGIRSRRFSSREVVESHLSRIDLVNSRLNAVVTLDAEGALAAADAADRGEPAGRLHGVPVAVKDLEETAGMRTTFGSPLFAANGPRTDSAAAARRRRGRPDRDGQTNNPGGRAGPAT